MSKTKAQSVIQTDDDTLYYERCAGIDVHKKLLVGIALSDEVLQSIIAQAAS